LVDENTPVGTAIAAGWNDDGTFPISDHGQHAAIVARKINAQGAYVYHQWDGLRNSSSPTVQIGFIPWSNRNAKGHQEVISQLKNYYTILFEVNP
jgi:hypothetical protein